MSGHEKWYVPHTDLLALIAAMGTLETDVETLNSNLLEFNKAMLELGTEASVTGDETVDAGYNTETIISEVLDASDDVYVKRVRVNLLSAEDIFLGYDDDISIAVSAGATTLLTEWFCDGKHPMVAIITSKDIWAGDRMFTLNDALVPAGATLSAVAYGKGLSANTTVNIWVFYAKEIGA